jgi:hypothetical protein
VIVDRPLLLGVELTGQPAFQFVARGTIVGR